MRRRDKLAAGAGQALPLDPDCRHGGCAGMANSKLLWTLSLLFTKGKVQWSRSGFKFTAKCVSCPTRRFLSSPDRSLRWHRRASLTQCRDLVTSVSIFWKLMRAHISCRTGEHWEAAEANTGSGLFRPHRLPCTRADSLTTAPFCITCNFAFIVLHMILCGQYCDSHSRHQVASMYFCLPRLEIQAVWPQDQK